MHSKEARARRVPGATRKKGCGDGLDDPDRGAPSVWSLVSVFCSRRAVWGT